MTETTSSARNLLFSALMRVPHRDYSALVPAFREAIANDPDFTARSCVHLLSGGTKIRDQADVAAITLLQADPSFPEYREAGRCLLLGDSIYSDIVSENGVSGLEPYRIFRIDAFIRASDRKVPRLMRNIATDYLETLEVDPLRFDSVVLLNRRAIKSMYVHYHVMPNERSQAILFENNPPADSKLAELKRIAAMDNPRDQAEAVLRAKLPYRVAVSVLPKMTPAVGIALIGVMSPTEALNSRAWIERQGLLEIPEVAEVYLEKVAKATRSVASAEHRKSAQGSDERVEAAVATAKETSVREGKRIERDTLLLVDKSGSMEVAIETAIKFGSRIAPLCDGALSVIAFNDYAQEISVRGNSLADWQQAFRGIRAGGQTSMQAGFERALRSGLMPEQIVIITDGGENVGNFSLALRNYIDHGADAPHVVVIRLPSRHWSGGEAFAQRIARAGIRVDEFFMQEEDYYIFDQVTELLGGPPATTLVDDILSIQLPYRKSFVR